MRTRQREYNKDMSEEPEISDEAVEAYIPEEESDGSNKTGN